jgi:hypothetical protein
LPALVHELNNDLAVVEAVNSLRSAATERERERACAGLARLRRSLLRLLAFARRPAEHEASLAALLEGCDVLVRPLAESARAEVALRAPPALADELLGVELSERLLCVLVACLPAPGEPGPAVRVRVGARSRAGRLVLSLVARLGAPAPGLRARVEELRGAAEGLGWRARLRGPDARLGIRLARPTESADALPSVSPRLRVLLVAAPGEERELVGTVLRELGCQLQEADEVPAPRPYDLVLVAEERARRDPDLAARLRGRCAPARVELLARWPTPEALLGLLRGET